MGSFFKRYVYPTITQPSMIIGVVGIMGNGK